jgi:hypothetical protein
MSQNDHDHDRDHDRDPANDNGNHERSGSKPIAPAPAAGALASLAALQAAFSSVDTSSLVVGSGRPLMLFKSREGGIWVFGRKRVTPEMDSQWAFNPLSFRWGFVCFDDQNKPTERMVSISQPKPDVTTLPDLAFPWQEQRAVDMRCVTGVDAGVEVTLKVNTVGGVQAIDGMIATVLNRLNSKHGGKVVPIALLKSDSYQHPERGKIWIPVLDVVDWMPFDGPAPAPTPVEPTPPDSSAPASAAVDQPRRRRAV